MIISMRVHTLMTYYSTPSARKWTRELEFCIHTYIFAAIVLLFKSKRVVQIDEYSRHMYLNCMYVVQAPVIIMTLKINENSFYAYMHVVGTQVLCMYFYKPLCQPNCYQHNGNSNLESLVVFYLWTSKLWQLKVSKILHTCVLK
jgi:uncharacterized membrane protein